MSYLDYPLYIIFYIPFIVYKGERLCRTWLMGSKGLTGRFLSLPHLVNQTWFSLGGMPENQTWFFPYKFNNI